ncbi:MAG: alpha/beta hydrolase [Alphaproteobacteria bacterium]|nr:alpha/beta hydrolase [Alphaproteobacteria bacterium]
MKSGAERLSSTIVHHNRRIAYEPQAGQAPGLMFLGGYASDMTGTKATFLAERCATAGHAFLRFDYSGHGQSEGRFAEGCIGDWYDDALAVFDQCTDGQQILIGSSMGGWLALKLACERPERVKAIIGIAAAPDFTEDLVWNQLTSSEQEQMQREGSLSGKGGDPLTYSYKLVLEGRQHLLLRVSLPIACPVILLQGQKDEAVPWQTAQRIRDNLPNAPVTVKLIPDGDHRLSAPEHLALLWESVVSLSV